MSLANTAYDAVERHHYAGDGQDLPAGITAQQGMHRGLGGQGRAVDRTGHNFARGVRVGQPCPQGRHRGVQVEPDQDQPGGRLPPPKKRSKASVPVFSRYI